VSLVTGDHDGSVPSAADAVRTEIDKSQQSTRFLRFMISTLFLGALVAGLVGIALRRKLRAT
jgi:hypothetical protein